MRLSHREEDHFVVTVSESELVLLSNGLLETLETLDAWDFETRTGGSIEDARSLMADIRRMLGH